MVDPRDKKIEELLSRVAIIERQMERIGAPLYRVNGNLLIERVKNLPKPNYKLRSVD